MKFYFTLIFLIFSISCFAVINRPGVDSLKSLVESSINSRSAPDTTTIDRLNALAANYFDTNPDSTVYYARLAMRFSNKINYRAGYADGLVQIAHVGFFKGRFVQAKNDFDTSIAVYKRINDSGGLANCYNLLARMYNLLARYDEALKYLNLALNIDLKYGYETHATECYKNIGIIYYSKGELSTALDYYYKALFIALKLHNTLYIAESYNDIGVVLQSMELYPKALEYFKKALVTFRDMNNLAGLGVVYENIGEVYLAQRLYDRAINCLRLGLAIVKKQDDKDGMMSIYTDYGLCYANKGNPALAMRFLDTALQMSSKYKNVYNESYTLIGLATAYNLQKDYKKAYQYAIAGQKMAVKLGNVSVRSNAALQLNKTLAGLGRYAEAYQLLQQYIGLRDSLNNNESIQKLTSYNLEMNFAEKQKQLTQQQHEKDLLYRQGIQRQRLISTIFFILIIGMIAVSVVYYLQKRKQQKINALLGEKNREVLLQKANIDDQAQKLNDLNVLKDRLISILAHDLRAPLSTLRGLFTLLQDETISHEQLLGMIPNVLKKLEYTSDFLDTLLFWINSQMENFDSATKNVRLKEIIALETENYREQAAHKGIQLIDSVADDIIAAADSNSVRIVVRNLISNAIKFSGAGDTIEISASQYDDFYYVITVKDTGTGMSEEQLSRLFKSKVTSKSGTHNESGTGMGMLFCKDLVEKCSGKIWVNSKQGEGTSFFFTLPIGVLSAGRAEMA